MKTGTYVSSGLGAGDTLRYCVRCHEEYKERNGTRVSCRLLHVFDTEPFSAILDATTSLLVAAAARNFWKKPAETETSASGIPL